MDSAQAQQKLPSDSTQLTEQDQKRIDDIAKSVNVNDTQMVVQFGLGAQTKVSEFSDQILNEIRTKDTGQAGEILTNLMMQVKELDVDSLSGSDSFLSKIPILGSLVNSSQKFIAKFESINTHIETIVDNLHKTRTQLLKDITMMDNLYQKNLEYFKELNLYILAGEKRLKELREVDIPALQAKTLQSNDPMDAQKYQDFVQMIDRFEKKIHDLKLSKMLALQTGPQIRLIQNSNQVLVEKIQSSIINTIPLWKNQIVIAIGLIRQKKGLELQKSVTDTTNDLLSKNSEMLKSGSIEIAKEAERGIIDIQTLKKLNDNLIGTIDETLRIQAEGREKRKQVESELIKIESELKNKLMEIKK